MDYDTLQMIRAAVNPIAMLLVIAPLIRRGRSYWPWVALVTACVGYLNFITYTAAPWPEKTWWPPAILTAIVLVGGIIMGILQRKYFKSRAKSSDIPASE